MEQMAQKYGPVGTIKVSIPWRDSKGICMFKVHHMPNRAREHTVKDYIVKLRRNGNVRGVRGSPIRDHKCRRW